jgi:hypothetical protein
VIHDALNCQRYRSHVESFDVGLIEVPMIYNDAKIAPEIPPGVQEEQVVGLLDVGGLESGTVLVDLLNPAFGRGVVLDVVEIEEQSYALGCEEQSD